jgi:hypothetical protein
VSIDLTAARAASQAVVDEYNAVLEETRSAVADDLRLFADFVQLHGRHIRDDNAASMERYGEGGLKVQLRPGESSATTSVLFATTALSDSAVKLSLLNGNVHVTVEGLYAGRHVDVVAIANGAEASFIASRIDWSQNKYFTRYPVELLRELAAEVTS